ncbi:MAG: hypothetical protein OXT06_23655 [Rhodospirillaceae bacterium]|nr:hypothetical protein [Rhodospirillaceae bacterium]MDD9915184.1 hypothetical protein [Rhodospirillaceae bacterium]MDD9925521.1 hypothetical protein [Rhodospirillaceae bacterium]
MLFPRFITSLIFVVAATFAGTAGAAPQILALVASNGVATPMHCADGTCKAELSSFCLQQERETPLAGTVYHAMAPDALTLVVEKSDGTTLRLPAGDRLRLTSERGSSSVLAQIDASGLGAARVSIEVADQVSLLPEAAAGDSNPLTGQEIAVVTASLRKLGSQVVDDGGVRIAAARETNRLINALDFSAEDAKSSAAWKKITAWKPGIRSGQYWANQRISHCQSKPAGPALGRCLRDWHDFLIRQLNTEYWDKARAGS